MQIINTILGLGASVIMPIVVFLLGVIFRMKIKNAIRAGLTVGIGFIGINLVVGLISDNLSSLVEALQTRFDLQLSITDVGWPAASGIAFGSGTFVFTSIIVFLAVNAVFLIFNRTHTLNVDIFNYWHFILIGTCAYYVTGMFALGIAVGAAFMILNTILAERQENAIISYAGEQWKGISFTTQGFPLQLLFARGCDWVLDRIPGVNKISFNLGKLPRSIAFLGEPAFIGLFLGILMGIFAGYTWDQILVVGITLAAVMLLLPRMVSVMMEGLAQLTDAAGEFMRARFKNRKFNIAMDYALLLGDRDVLTVGVLAIPIVLILAFVLPGNKFMPFVDLAALPYWMIGPVVGTKHNTFRALIVAVVSLAVALYMVTDLAPLMTQMAESVGFDFTPGSIIASFCAGWEWVGYILFKPIELLFELIG
jgi:PTS system galactitol-specific IIC component